jgi:hypothetical protein
MFDVNQGKHFLKERRKKMDKTKKEGFENQNLAEDSNRNNKKKSNEDDDTALVQELNILEDEFNKKKSDYATAYKALMDKTQGYMTSSDNINRKINKNVYVNRANDLENVVPTRVGCYRTTNIADDANAGLLYQSDLGTSVSAETCRVRAADLGHAAYALRRGVTDTTNSLCYTGKNMNNATAAGFAYKIITAYEFSTKEGANLCTLLYNGQIGLWNNWAVNIWDSSPANRGAINDNLMIDPTTPAGNASCRITTGGEINTDDTVASYGANCKTIPSSAMIYGNNGTISCQKYCHGQNGTPWQGPSELPSEWKGAQCESAGKYKTTDCNYVGQDPATPGIMPCTCIRNDNFPYETRNPWRTPNFDNPPIINPETPSTGIGNWTSYIVNKIIRGNKVKDNYVVLSEGADPAYGCPKQFSANYKCGNFSTKIIYLDAEAAGKSLDFDCSEEVRTCQNFRMTLTDIGRLSITNINGNEIWSFNAGKPDAVANDAYKASNGKNQRNFLLAGESLGLNEFLGSPSGNYHIIFLNDPATNQRGLKLRYSVYNCGEVMGNDATSNVIYQINPVSTELLGKVGFINGEGALQEYPREMVKPGTDYDSLGNYDSVGHDLSQFSMPNVSTDDCRTKCSADKDCAGFVFNNSDKVCYLKDAGMFPAGLRIADSNAELYVRAKITDGGDVSCPKTMDKGISAYEWARMPVGKKMQMSTLCKLGLVTQEEQRGLEMKDRDVSIAAANLQDKLDDLVQNDMDLVNKLGNHVNKLQKDLKQYKVINEKIGMNEHTIEGLRGFADDSETRLTANISKYFLMVVLGLFLVGTIIKVSRR